MIEVFTVGTTLDTDKAFSLHNICFGDCRAWFDRFLQAVDGERYLAAVSGENYIGGLFLLDVTYGENTGKYVYALGVHPDHRGKGIARELLEKAKALSRDFTLICPADGKLAATYEKYGFDRYIGGTVPVGAEKGAAVAGKFDTPCTYTDVRGLKLPERLFAFALKECGAALYTDGKTVIAKAEDGVYGAWGLPARVPQKAQMYVKKGMDTSGILADLILEI